MKHLFTIILLATSFAIGNSRAQSDAKAPNPSPTSTPYFDPGSPKRPPGPGDSTPPSGGGGSARITPTPTQRPRPSLPPDKNPPIEKGTPKTLPTPTPIPDKNAPIDKGTPKSLPTPTPGGFGDASSRLAEHQRLLSAYEAAMQAEFNVQADRAVGRATAQQLEAAHANTAAAKKALDDFDATP